MTDFAWSHDGRMALICYLDGFVLVGSVAGQRYWSSMLNLDSCTITCGVWAPDDQKVRFMDAYNVVLMLCRRRRRWPNVTCGETGLRKMRHGCS